jgi:hypothetical protein
MARPSTEEKEAGITVRPLFAIREACERAVLSVSGHLRARPEPSLEDALRTAFADLDRELATILDGRYAKDPPGDFWTTSRRLSFTEGKRPGHGVRVASQVCG